MNEVNSISYKADFIVNGYSFSREDGRIKVRNLKKADRATVLSEEGEMLETSMDDIELAIVIGYFQKNRRFLED